MRLLIALAAAVVLPVAAVAAPGAPPTSAPSRTCFYTEDVTGFRVPTDRVVYVSTARGETFRLDALTDCSWARSAQSIGFRTLANDRVCGGIDVQVVVPGGGATGVCPISRVTRLTPAETAALTADERP